jgi:hypothetical protein
MAVFGSAGSATTHGPHGPHGPHGSNGSGRGIPYGRTRTPTPQWPQRQPSQPVPPEATTKATGVAVRTRMICMDKNNGEALSSVPRSRRTNGNSDRPVLTLHTGIACAENPIEPRIEGEAH